VKVITDGAEDCTFKNQAVMRDPDTGDILLAALVENIRHKGSPTDSCSVFYWSEVDRSWVFSSRTPIPPDIRIPISDLNAQNIIQIKLRPTNNAEPKSSRSKRGFNQLSGVDNND